MHCIINTAQEYCIFVLYGLDDINICVPHFKYFKISTNVDYQLANEYVNYNNCQIWKQSILRVN